MTLREMAAACSGILHARGYEEQTERNAAQVAIDSREIQEGGVFIAVKGERTDGHHYIAQVFAKGALGVICERVPKDAAGPFILVKDSLQALKDMAECYRRTLSIPVVGITGSVGKTSTKELIASVLAQRFKVLKTAGNHNNEIGLPLTVLTIEAQHEAAVLEMGISEFGEMHRLSKIARPDICVITNIGQCHLENLHTRDGILKAKSEIFDYMSPSAHIFLNGDDDKLCTVREVRGIRPVFFGLSAENAYYADEIENRGLFGTNCRIHTPQGDFEAQIPLPGVHMVYNALAATAVGMALGIGIGQIQAGIVSVKPVGGRSNIIRLADRTIIDDCYNASPASVRGALDLLSSAATRRVAILGDMFELGENERQLHREIGVYAAQGKCDVLIGVGTLAKELCDAARESGKELPHTDDQRMRVLHVDTLEELEKELPDVLQPEDTILVKASHGMGLAHVVEFLRM
ncbi:MAG: UDP-N-acetylmuramoyl-tripeptide--D-alanyl-D-alanine ligase [bacterium]|nr:UDP-N-acetylmuramoyl-tripeptide--D-alanyl-D-alanine ligase [bacterium]